MITCDLRDYKPFSEHTLNSVQSLHDMLLAENFRVVFNKGYFSNANFQAIKSRIPSLGETKRYGA